MAKNVELPNGKYWQTQTAAQHHFKEMLARYEDGDVIHDVNDHDDLSALLERYDTMIPDGPSKIGVGIGRFEKRKSFINGFPSRGFWVVRVDGSETDFSYKNAISGASKPQSQEFYDACHNAVSEDLRRAKEKQFDSFSDADGCLQCDVSGDLVSFTNARLSHSHPPFITIVNEFRLSRGWAVAIPTGVLTTSADRQISTNFANKADADAFKTFHHQVAVLRILAAGQVSNSFDEVKRPIRLK